jgi:hypothetical protein
MGLRTMKEKGYVPQRTFFNQMVRGGLSISKIILLNMRELKKTRVIKDDAERYVLPTLQYSIPEHEPGMRFCDSDEKYLRPTLHCDSHDPWSSPWPTSWGRSRSPTGSSPSGRSTSSRRS